MLIKLDKPNINTPEYLDKVYAGNWRDGYGDAIKRLQLLVDSLEEYQEHLDVGCADGTFTKLYLEKYPHTHGYGIDMAQTAIELTGDKHFTTGDIYKIHYGSEMFDLVTCSEVIEHLEDPQKAIDEMYRVLKPEGVLVITVPNEHASDYEEHLWKWDLEGFKTFLKSFKILEEKPTFFNDSIMYIKTQKI